MEIVIGVLCVACVFLAVGILVQAVKIQNFELSVTFHKAAEINLRKTLHARIAEHNANAKN